MVRMLTFRLLLGVCSLSGLVATVYAQNAEVETAIQEVLRANFAAANEEDVVGYLLSVHFDSPVYEVTQEALEPQFRNYDLAFELLELRLLSVDGEYAVARGRQKTTKLGDSDFQDNVTEALYVFRREAGAWKLWQQSPLEVEFLE